MNIRPFLTALVLLDVALGVFCLTNIPSVIDRPALPLLLEQAGPDVVVRSVADDVVPADIRPGDALVRWDTVEVVLAQQVELLADLRSVGDRIPLTVRSDDVLREVTVPLVRYYPSLRFAAVVSIAGGTLFLFALFLLFQRPSDPATIALHWTLVATGTLILITQGRIEGGDFLSEARRGLLIVSYNMTAASFFVFSTQFPVRRAMSFPTVAVVPTAFLAFAIMLIAAHLQAVDSGDPAAFEWFQRLYSAFHLTFFVTVAVGLSLLVAGYQQERLSERKAALRWIMWGLIGGVVPFLVLVIAPQLLMPRLRVAEELAILCTLAIPVSLTVAFLRYHMFDIVIRQRQRLAALALRTLTTVLQMLTALVLVSLVSAVDPFGPSMGEALLVAVAVVALIPARKALQRVLEVSIFPSRADLHRILDEASRRFQDVVSSADVVPVLRAEIARTVPRLDVDAYRWSSGSMTEVPPSPPLTDATPGLTASLRDAPLTVRKSPGRAAESDTALVAWMARVQYDLLLPVRGRERDDRPAGILLCRLRAHAAPLDASEIDLLRTLTAQAAAVNARLALQEKVIFEHQERERFEELARMRSRFVSGVSHDLRTPLTSMTMFLDMLRGSKVSARRRKEYIALIGQEADRLRRLVENVLQFARMERGVREFRLEVVDPVPVIRSAAETMAGQFSLVEGVLDVRIPRTLPTIRADAQALERAIVNVLSNAYKYSTGTKRVALQARVSKGALAITVSDRGIGIAPEHLARIFDPFYRASDRTHPQTGGIGLGLSLVKHTVEEHGGHVEIDSRPGKGTTVRMIIPAAERRPSRRKR